MLHAPKEKFSSRTLTVLVIRRDRPMNESLAKLLLSSNLFFNYKLAHSCLPYLYKRSLPPSLPPPYLASDPVLSSVDFRFRSSYPGFLFVPLLETRFGLERSWLQLRSPRNSVARSLPRECSRPWSWMATISSPSSCPRPSRTSNSFRVMAAPEASGRWTSQKASH